MDYKVERIEELAENQTLLSDLFVFIGQHSNPNLQLRTSWQHFFQTWGGQTPFVQMKVLTARENGELKGCVMALLVENPLFIGKPTINRFVNITNNDNAFDDYVSVILASL